MLIEYRRGTTVFAPLYVFGTQWRKLAVPPLVFVLCTSSMGSADTIAGYFLNALASFRIPALGFPKVEFMILFMFTEFVVKTVKRHSPR